MQLWLLVFLSLQSYILSTTTETIHHLDQRTHKNRFNRTSFQQQLKLSQKAQGVYDCIASIVHPFNNNWNVKVIMSIHVDRAGFNRTSFQQQLKQWKPIFGICSIRASIVHPFNNNWNDGHIRSGPWLPAASIVHPFNNNWNLARAWIVSQNLCFNRTSFQQQLKRKSSCDHQCRIFASIVHPFNNNWNQQSRCCTEFCLRFNRTSFQQQLKLEGAVALFA